MKRKSVRRRRTLVPQIYQPRCEITIAALTHALAGSALLARFLFDQTGPDWRDLDEHLDSGGRELRRALFWLNKRKKL